MNAYTISIALLMVQVLGGLGVPQTDEPNRKDAYTRYAEGLLRRYDNNQDGYIDEAESKIMRKRPQNADTDHDGLLSLAELKAWVSVQTGTAAVSNFQTANDESQPGSKHANVTIQLDLLELSSEADIQLFLTFSDQLNSEEEDAADLIAALKKSTGVTSSSYFQVCPQLEQRLEAELRDRNTGMGIDISILPRKLDEQYQLSFSLETVRTNTKTNSNTSAPKPTPDTRDKEWAAPEQLSPKSREELEMLILKKIEKRKAEQKKKSSSNSSLSKTPSKSLRIKSTTLCEADKGFAMLFSEQGHKWIVVFRVKK